MNTPQQLAGDEMKKKRPFNEKKVRKRALKCFRIIYGKGDCGSEHNFDCMNPSFQRGWLALARYTIQLQSK